MSSSRRSSVPVLIRSREVFQGDEGASEVVGSILMVAITVALAAGLVAILFGAVHGEEPALHASPSGSLNPNQGGWGSGDETVTLTHEGGRELPVDQIEIVVAVADQEIRFTEGGANPLDHAGEDAFDDGAWTIGERWTSTALTVPPDTDVFVEVVDVAASDTVWRSSFRSGVNTVSYVETPLDMVTGTAENDTNARSADDGGAAATLTEAIDHDNVEMPADTVVGTSDFTPGSDVFALDGSFANTSHSVAVVTGGEDDTLRKLTLDGAQAFSASHPNKVLGVDLGSDGFAYTAGEDDVVRKVDPSGTTVWSFTGHSNKVHDVAVDKDGFVYTASEDNTVRKLDSTGTQVWSFTGHTKKVFGVAVDEDGFVYTASEDETVRKLDSTGTQVWSFTGHTSKVHDVAVDKDGFVYSASEDDTARKIDSTGSQVWSFTGHTNKVLGIAVDQNGFVYTASEDDTARKIDSTGSQVWSFTGHTNKVLGIAVDQNGFVYTASEDDTARKIDSTGSQVWSFTGHTNKVLDVAVHNEDRAIRVGFADQSPLDTITKVQLKAHVRASATSNEWRLEGCFSGGGCTGASSGRTVGTTAETITYDVTDEHPGGGSWTWSDINDLEGIVTASATNVDVVDLEIDHVWLDVEYETGFGLETDRWTFDAFEDGGGATLQVRYKTGGSESYRVEIWDGSSWNTQSPILDQSSFTLFSEVLTSGEVWAGPEVRILDEGTADGTEGTLDLDYVRVVTS